MKWLRRIFLFLLVVILLFLVFAFISARVIEAQLLSQVPEGSQLYDVGGRNIHVYTAGLDHPDDLALVFVSCIGCNSGLYQAIQLDIAQEVRTYAFDQAGMAWSDAGELLTPSNIATDLGAFLQQLDEEQIILVGFSSGMLVVHAYYAKQVDGAPEVVGLVSLEGAILTEYEASLYYGSSPLGLSPLAADFLIESGIARLIAPLLQMARPDTISNPEYYDKALAMNTIRRAIRAWHDHYSPEYIANIEQIVELDPPYDVVVYVFDPDNRPLVDGSANGGDLEYVEELNENYVPYFEDWVANAADGSRYIPVSDSSHFVMFDQAQVVINGILELVAQVRTG